MDEIGSLDGKNGGIPSTNSDQAKEGRKEEKVGKEGKAKKEILNRIECEVNLRIMIDELKKYK